MIKKHIMSIFNRIFRREESETTNKFFEFNELTSLIEQKYSISGSKGGSFLTENLDTAVGIATDIIKKTNLFSKVESIEEGYEPSARYQRVPILYSGSIDDIHESLMNYSKPAIREKKFKHFQIKCPRSNEYPSVASCEYGIVYQTHIDPLYINKTEDQTFFIFGILPPYAGNLKPHKKYFDWVPRKIYESD